TDWLSVTLQVCDLMEPPNSATRASVSVIASASRSTAKTLAPSRANNTAMARPLPQPGPTQPAPATSATLSCKRPGMGTVAPALLRAREAEALHQSAPLLGLGLDVTLGLRDRRRVERDQAKI